jgi:hypothetical protein
MLNVINYHIYEREYHKKLVRLRILLLCVERRKILCNDVMRCISEMLV